VARCEDRHWHASDQNKIGQERREEHWIGQDRTGQERRGEQNDKHRHSVPRSLFFVSMSAEDLYFAAYVSPSNAHIGIITPKDGVRRWDLWECDWVMKAEPS
jgi:hypothetical protein